MALMLLFQFFLNYDAHRHQDIKKDITLVVSYIFVVFSLYE